MEFRPWIEMLAKATAAYEEPLLILGPTGSGKEYLARRIAELRWQRILERQGGKPSGQPFVALNIGALDATFLRSELRGHVAGAFTDAKKDKPSVFELAGAGTCFLDEIGELPKDLQVHLLRVIEERVVVPLGGTEPKKVQCLVIAATNRTEVMEDPGTFRRDLRMRFGRVLELPPLKARAEERLEILKDVMEDIQMRWSQDLVQGSLLEEILGSRPAPREQTPRRRRRPRSPLPTKFSLAYLANLDLGRYREGNLREFRQELVWQFRFFSEWALYWGLPEIRAFHMPGDVNQYELMAPWSGPKEFHKRRMHFLKVASTAGFLLSGRLTAPDWAGMDQALQGMEQAGAIERRFAHAMEGDDDGWTWKNTDARQVARTLADQFESIYNMAEEPMPWKKRFTHSLTRGLGRYFRLRDQAEDATDDPTRARDLLARAQRALKQSVGLERYIPVSGLVTREMDARVSHDFPWLTSFPFQIISSYLPDLVDQIAMDSPAFESFTSEHMKNYLSSLVGMFEAVETVERGHTESAPDTGTGGEASAKGAFSIQGPDWPRLEDVKAAYTAFVMKETQGDKKAAQAILDISRNSLNKYLAFSETDG